MSKNLDDHVREMTGLSRLLIRYSFPLTSASDEELISCLKQREIELDGYELVVYFNHCQYDAYELRTLQVFGKRFTFLPFHLVCKIAVRFLGYKDLSLIEIVYNRSGQESAIDHESRKIYVWTVYTDSKGTVPHPFVFDKTADSYGGLLFSRIERHQIMFF